MQRTIVVCSFLIVAVVAVAAGLGWFQTQNEHQLNRELVRELVRAKIDICRTVYQDGGITGLQTWASREPTNERDPTFVEVINSDKSVRFSQGPLPASQPHRVWTIGRTVLPDGKILFVGRVRSDSR